MAASAVARERAPGAATPRVRAAGAWTLLLGSSVVYFFTANQADNDLWGHVFFGRYILRSAAIPWVDTFAYTTAGQHWVDHEWLSQVLLAAVYDHGGAKGLLLLKFAVGAATCLLVWTRVRRHAATPHIWGGIGVLALAVLARGFAIRPQIFTYCGAALTLWLLDRHRRGHHRALWYLVPIFLAWANLHGGFTLGLAILGLFAVAEVVRVGGSPRRAWIVVVASTAVTALNPYGPRLLTYVWSELRRAHPITEWRPATPGDASHFAFFVLLGLFVVTLPLLRDWREHGWEVVLALGVGLLAVRHQRHTPVFALCAAAPVASHLEQTMKWLKQKPSVALGAAAQRLLIAGLAVLAVLQIVFTALRVRRDGMQIVFDPADYPTAAVAALRQAGAPTHLAVPLDWGEYVLWFLAPQTQVSLDGRFATVFPEVVVADNFAFFSGAPGWRRLLEQYPTDAALVPAGSACPIGTLADWQLVFRSDVARIYARTGSAAWPALRRLRELPPPAASAGIFP